jgi:putative transposase
LQEHVEQAYGVVFESKQSYYSLFEQAGISWRKTQKRNPKTALEAVEKKQEISTWLAAHRDELCSGELAVFFEDECHLLWGDLCGYVWGKTDERIEVPIANEPKDYLYSLCCQRPEAESNMRIFGYRRSGSLGSTITCVPRLM